MIFTMKYLQISFDLEFHTKFRCFMISVSQDAQDNAQTPDHSLQFVNLTPVGVSTPINPLKYIHPSFHLSIAHPVMLHHSSFGEDEMIMRIVGILL